MGDIEKKQKDGAPAAALITTATAAGAAIGSVISPGIGTAIGAMAGAVGSGVAVIIDEVNKKK